MKIRFLPLVCFVAACFPAARGAVLSQYSFTGSSDAAAVLAGVTGGIFTPSAGITGGSAGDATLFNGFSTGATTNTAPAASSQPVRYVRGNSDSANTAAAITNGDYFSFTLAPTVGNQLSLQTLTIDISSNGSSIANTSEFALVSSFNGFSSGTVVLGDVIGTPGSVTAPGSAANAYIRYTVDLSGADYQNLTGTTTFRLYVSSSNNAGVARLDNVIINGTVLPVPEPSALALAGLGGMLVTVRRRKA
jgi:hypothetical protein